MSGALPLQGVVVSVRGTVIDARFESALPSIGAAIVCHAEGRSLTAEVTGHSGATTLRAIAIESTRGLRRGDPAESDGRPLAVPVGPELLGAKGPLAVRERDWLRTWIEEPSRIRPQTRMEPLNPALPDRARVVERILAYLEEMAAAGGAGGH